MVVNVYHSAYNGYNIGVNLWEGGKPKTMIIQVENKNPKVTFLTLQGNRTPKMIWIDTATGNKDTTKKGVIAKNERWERLGITTDTQ
jgi:hypothetical protein